jgi:hypothetical protein
MAVGGRPDVPSYPRDQIGQILQSSEPAKLAEAMVYREALEKDGTSLYRSGTYDKAKFLVY